jgi:hypothetical protein
LYNPVGSNERNKPEHIARGRPYYVFDHSCCGIILSRLPEQATLNEFELNYYPLDPYYAITYPDLPDLVVQECLQISGAMNHPQDFHAIRQGQVEDEHFFEPLHSKHPQVLEFGAL